MYFFQDGVVFLSAVRLGNIPDVTEEALKHVYNKRYVTNMTVYVYSDGEKVETEGGISTVDSVAMTTLNIYLLASSAIFVYVLSLFNGH